MKKMLVRLAILLDGVAVGLILGLLLTAEQRERLSRQLAVLIDGLVVWLPDE
jgi:hypothetical protein